MRITNSMMIDQYARQLDQNAEQVSDDTQQMSTNKKYARASQDPVDAASMVETNGQLATISRYQSNITSAQSWLTETETVVKTNYYSILQSANTTLNTASNTGTNSNVNNQGLGADLEVDQTKILSQLNATFGGQYVFGGSTTGNPPFKAGTENDYNTYTNYVAAFKTVYENAYDSATTDKQTAAENAVKTAEADPSTDLGKAKSALTVAPAVNITSDGSTATVSAALNETDVAGKLLYQVPAQGGSQYIPVSKINNSAQTATTTKYDLSYYSTENSAMTRTSPADLGYGAQLSSGSVVNGTAFELSTDPLDFLLQNVTSTGSANVYDSFGVTSAKLVQNDTSTVQSTFSLNTSAMDATSLTNSVLGAKQTMLSFLSDKYSADSINMTQRLSNVEDVDTATAYMQYSMHTMAYQACLAISSTILQSNLTDYLK